MPETIHSMHTLMTLIAVGILFGGGFALAQRAVAWPADRIVGGALIICVLILVIAWLV